jgi:hypothetical protein
MRHPVPSLMMLLNWLPYLSQALPEVVAVAPAQQAEIDQVEAAGLPGRGFRTSWQAEYDGPPFDQYLGR